MALDARGFPRVDERPVPVVVQRTGAIEAVDTEVGGDEGGPQDQEGQKARGEQPRDSDDVIGVADAEPHEVHLWREAVWDRMCKAHAIAWRLPESAAAQQ
jgi:hypothetical protein